MTDTPVERPPRVAIWCAVSSKPQAADDKISLEYQEQTGRQFARAIDGHVVRVYTVPGHTRDLIFWHEAETEMEAYQQLRLDCQDGLFDVLYALDPDRLGRDPALSNQVISLVEKSGAEVYLASAPHTLGQKSTGTRYVYAIQTVRAGEEQQRRTINSRLGLHRRVERGLPANSRWPVGYRVVRNPRGRVIGAGHDENAEAVRLATRLFCQGQPYRSICHALDATPYRPPFADHWPYHVVRKLLHNDIYAGYLHWGDCIPDTPSDRFPPIWDAETHQAVKRERQRRSRRTYRRTSGSAYLDVAFCARCADRMTRSNTTRKGVTTYFLRCRTHSIKSITGVSCHPNWIKETAVAAAISTYLNGLLDQDLLQQQLAGTGQDRHEQIQKELRTVAQQFANTERKRQRLAHALAAGNLDPQMYRATDDQLLAIIDTLQQTQDELTVALETIPDNKQRQEIIIHLAQNPNLSALELNTLFQNIGLRVEVEHGEITAIRLT